MKSQNIREGEIIKKVAEEFFQQFDTTELIGDIDFAVKLRRPASAIDFADEYLLWAEAKQKPTDILVMLTQLVLTIGKARTFDEYMPPKFLGAFDNEKIAFIPYHEIQDIFYQNDFNWNVAPSNHETKEFKQIYNKIDKIINNNLPFISYEFYFEKDEKELKKFIKENFIVGKSDVAKLRIDKNNFIIIYNKWLETVKPTIAVNWEIAKKNGLIDGDFYLADLLSTENQTITEKLLVLLKSNHYVANRRFNEMGMFSSDAAEFTDSQKAHNQFWAKYERPPLEEYWDYIIERHDLLVPQDIRERKGSFFTPRIWVEKSQEYLAKVFGENWQDEYYIWDCCAGTGNLLAGLTNKYNIWASTIDKADVDIMHERINNGANLLESHVFQFDFLNDDFLPVLKGGKLPDKLYEIISDEEKRKKLVIYINPPYVEAASARTITGTGINRTGVAVNKTNTKYRTLIGSATNELFALFLIRIYKEINGCKIGQFSTQKILNAPNFKKFRKEFLAKLARCFIIPANTFDNVKGQFPIGFKIWDTEIKEHFKQGFADVFDAKGKFSGKKTFYDGIECKYINDWYKKFYDKENTVIGIMNTRGNDVQNYNYIRISLDDNKNHTNPITINNLIPSCIYFAVRKVITPTWLNDRDQFLYPNFDYNYSNDLEFHMNCLVYALFNNNIQSKYGINHWIPFTEQEVNAKEKFDSNFMSDFLTGKLKYGNSDLFTIIQEKRIEKECIYRRITMSNKELGGKTILERRFSTEATAVFDAGRELWKYYHKQKNINVNASLYDIKWYFKKSSLDKKGKERMNNKSTDIRFNELEQELSKTLKLLAQKIEPKVYEYEFLMK